MLIWKELELNRVLETKVTKNSGIYVIKQVDRVMGLPIKHGIVYVGQTKNLRRRFKEHCNPKTEHNTSLLNSTLCSGLEFWYAEVVEDRLDEVEKTLVRKLKPEANIIRYRNNK